MIDNQQSTVNSIRNNNEPLIHSSQIIRRTKWPNNEPCRMKGDLFLDFCLPVRRVNFDIATIFFEISKLDDQLFFTRHQQKPEARNLALSRLFHISHPQSITFKRILMIDDCCHLLVRIQKEE